MALSAVFDDLGANQLSVEIGVFKQLLEQVDHSSQVELVASKESFKIRSFHLAYSTASTTQRHMTSEMIMHTREFLHYRYCSNEPVEELVVSIKELKSIIAFCEAIEIPIFSIYFYGGGRPCKLSCEHATFTVSIVVATLEPPGRAGSQDNSNAIFSGDDNLLSRFQRHDRNIDSTVGRLVSSVPSESGIYSATVLGDSPGDGSVFVSDGDEAKAVQDVSLEVSNLTKQASSDKTLIFQKTRKSDRDAELVDPMSISAESDIAVSFARSAFSRSSLKRLIESDSDDDEFGMLRDNNSA